MRSVLINCPGGWSHGLDSPEKGEGRWAQNLAKVLARSGRYEVFASSGGPPQWGRGERVAATLLSEPEAAKGIYDIYIDAAWWDGKPAVGAARVSFHVHWWPEQYVVRRPLPAGHFLVYVYRAHEHVFMVAANANLDRTLFLPGAYGAMRAPDPAARGIVCTLRGLGSDRAPHMRLYEAVSRLRQSFCVPFSWIDHADYPRPSHPDDSALAHPPGEPWGIPYNEMIATLARAGVNVALGGGASIMDCALLGIPSIIRARTSYDFIDAAACVHGASIGLDPTVDEIEIGIRRLFDDPGLYVDYVRFLQGVYADHTDTAVLAQFDAIAARVLA
jgi:hypothetical protein